MRYFFVSVFTFFIYSMSHAEQPTDVQKIFSQHCATCHGASRLGGIGPALLPENLKRLRRNKAIKVIASGRLATQMPAFGDKLSKVQIKGLVDFIYTPLPRLPEWGLEQINKTHVIYHKPGSLPAKPLFKADPLNLFIVVEIGDHHATLMDGDRFEPIHRFQTRFALHGGPKYSPDGRFVYFASRDGWISKYDIYNLKMVAEIRAGINTRNLAISGDGRYVMVGNYLPHTLLLLDAVDLKPIKYIPVVNEHGTSSRVSEIGRAHV